MSASNGNSVGRRPQTPTASPPRRGGLWIALIAVFGLVVVGLNVMLFVLLQGHQRALDVRTTALQQRENAVTAQNDPAHRAFPANAPEVPLWHPLDIT